MSKSFTPAQIAAMPGMAAQRTIFDRCSRHEIPGARRVAIPQGHGHQWRIPNTPQALAACASRPPGRPRKSTKDTNP